MLHEVLLALLGHPGSIIREEPSTPPGSSSPGTSSHSHAFDSGSTFRVPDTITFLTPTERAAINRVVGLGRIYRDLRRFVRPKSLKWEGAVGNGAITISSGPVDDTAAVASTVDSAGAVGTGVAEEDGLYLRALKLGVVEVLDEYAERVAEVEKDVMADPTLTLARVYGGVREVSSRASRVKS